jgi:PAS domain S-box-containing protein
MRDGQKTKKQLLAELSTLRERVAELERSGGKRQQAVSPLEASGETARTLLDAPFGIATLIDTAGTIIDLNEPMARSMGKSRQELLGTTIWKLFPEDVTRRRKAHVDTVIQTRKPIRVEDQGEHGWYESVLCPIFDIDGQQVSRVVIIAFDITDRKAMEQQGDRRRLYLEGILACAPDAIVALDHEHLVLDWNPGAQRLFGYTQEEVLGQHIDLLITGSDTAALEEASGYTQTVLEGKVLAPTEAIRYHKDGTPVNVIVAGAPIMVQDRLVGAVGVYTDITERKKAEEEIRQRTAQLEALRDTGRDLSAVLDLEVLLDSIVARAVSLLDGTFGGLYLYRPDEDALEWALKVGDHPAPIGALLAKGEGLSGRVWESGEALIVDDYGKWEGRARAFGTPPPAAVLAVPIQWGETFLGVLNVVSTPPRTFSAADAELLSLFATDAAIAIENARLYREIQLQTSELADAVTQLKELDQLKSEFIQNVSHELRSPLALILGYAEILASGELGELDGRQQKPVQIIARRSRMLSDLVSDILLILEIEASPRQPEPVQMDQVVLAAVEDFQLTVQQAGITLHADIASDLPPVSGYPIYLRRVVDNLVDNAIKFTPAEGIIAITVEQESDCVVLQISDSGIGVPQDQLERIFERFYQVDGSPKRRYGGVGLGLALVREIVQTYGGTVTASSRPGEGSTFKVSLPIRR